MKTPVDTASVSVLNKLNISILGIAEFSITNGCIIEANNPYIIFSKNIEPIIKVRIPIAVNIPISVIM